VRGERHQGPYVRISYDQQSDAATISLAEQIPAGGAPHSLMTDLEVKNGAVILLLNEQNQLVGLEVLGASRVLPACVLSKAATAE
jgi:uncharacterized protein YuzE